MVSFMGKIHNITSDRKIAPLILAFSWSFGSLFGVLIVRSASEYFVPFVRSVVSGTVSVSGLLASVLFPFLFSELAILYRRSFLYLICFIKAFCLGVCVKGIALAYGSSAWLIYSLLLFSDNLIIPVLYAYWLRALEGSSFQRNLSFMVHVIYSVIIVLLDVYLISPILSEVIR